MRFSTLAVVAASAASAVAEDKYLGFNSGATTDAGVIKKQADFEKEFAAQQKLTGAPGVFNAVRLYTNIQPTTESSPEPIEAFAAAIKTKTKLLLGMWTSGTKSVDGELSALEKAIKTYGKDFTDLVVGISVGSEDLYRSSADGVSNKAGVGAEASVLTQFIKDTRARLSGTALKNTPIGHVDTWTAWTNSSNAEFIEAVDFLGADLYPYYESGANIGLNNAVENAFPIFETAMNATIKAAGNKPVWITETGWPTTGPTWNSAVPSNKNAEKYWQEVGCQYFGQLHTFWYIQRDSNPDNEMKFGLSPKLDGTPLYNLTCPSVPKKTTSSSSTSNSTSSGNGTSTTGSGNSTGSGSANSSTSAPEGVSAGAFTAVSKTTLVLSAVFAVAAWML
ncbi:glycoside hydrolase [Massarina eburnea CBS 473.64]|uniref:Glycoside hydrolase n=1 Tax=Massarina eburnea CBS 473.64 TaxID=1395130 RepID=A0A6A6SH27_9PLEO|nr:glycoside hydrolase [Massarina eburnea CBS 473.64]